MKKQLLMISLCIFTCGAFSQVKRDSLQKRALTDSTLYGRGYVEVPKSKSERDTTPTPPSNDLSGFGTYNFGGGNTGFNSPQAQVDYGFKFGIGGGSSYFEFRPSISTSVNAALKKSYLPALMLPGNAALSINTFFPLGEHFLWSPVNVGLKFLSGFTDSAKTLVQHNIRTAIAYKIDDLFMITAQYTWAWHNGSDESEKNYSFIFNKGKSDIKYLTLTLQGRVSAANAVTPSFIIVQWRNLLNSGEFPGLPNYRIFSIGFKATINPTTGTPAK